MNRLENQILIDGIIKMFVIRFMLIFISNR